MSKNHLAMECPVCEYPTALYWADLGDRLFKTTDKMFRLFECKSCGLLFQDANKIEQALSQYYPAGYWWFDSGGIAAAESLYRNWVVRNDHVKKFGSFLSGAKSLRFLEIGCGSGVFLAEANRAGFDVSGLDSSEQAVRVARKSTGARIYRGDISDLIQAGEKFDGICLFHTLEHIPHPFQYLKKVKQLLNKPGHLIVQVPNRASLQSRILRSRWYGLDCPRHVQNFTEYSLLYLLGRSGFRIHEVCHFSLRDNSPALVSSLFSWLDPVASKVEKIRASGDPGGLGMVFKEGVYFAMVVLAQPFAWLEAKMGKGATVTTYGTWE